MENGTVVMIDQNSDFSLLNIAGWSKMSTVDWPGELVVTLFLQGCPLKCNYCHNYLILDPNIKGEVSFEDDVLQLLKKRTTLLDGVVFSGGEPLMQANASDGGRLRQAILAVKNVSPKFKIGLHTAGSYPDNLAKIIDLVDWIGFDIKAPWDKYHLITHVLKSDELALKSINIINEYQKSHKLDVQYRTTIDPTVFDANDQEKIVNQLKNLGISDVKWQEVRAIGANEEYQNKLKMSIGKS